MEFINFVKHFKDNFENLTNEVNQLYEVDCDKDELWNLYLNNFPVGTNEIYRKRREYDCSACRHFIKTAGNIVIIKNNKVHTIWDFDANSATFQPVIDALNHYVLSKAVTNIFVSKEKKIGIDKSLEITTDGIVSYPHLNLNLPNKFVDRTSRSIGDIKGEFRDIRNVFKRSLDEISIEAVDTVLELIADNSLYRGSEWKNQLESFRSFKAEYDELNESEKEAYAWENASVAGVVIGKIRNHSIGTLLTNISEGMDLETAVKKYEQIVAPTNYKRPKAIFTAKMLENARKTIESLGYTDSLVRRFAALDDITVNNILFSNRDAKTRIKGTDNVFDEMMGEVKSNPKKFDRVEEVTIDRFINNILPTARTVEACVENRHQLNFVSLTAPQNEDAPTMFKWNNAFGWAYSGNITDSDIRENVKNAGGNVEGVLRFSIQWNDEDYNPNDFDAHCTLPDRHEIYYAKSHDYGTDGDLDVDIIRPTRGTPAVENIVFPSKWKLKEGTYHFYVHCFNYYGGRSGFKAEVEANGEVHSYVYPHGLKQGEDVVVATVEFDGDKFTIKDTLDSNTSVQSKNIWNIDTNVFVPVTTIMYSPNYWDEQTGNGNRHYFFMLKDCVNPEQPNGFYNEFLKPELLPHKHVLEALGAKLKVENAEDQLSGLGFSSTQRNELVVKVTGQVERVLKIKF